MKYQWILLLITLSSCIRSDIEPCPYELKNSFSGHYLETPLTITPHKMVYHVGDTITFSTIFSDSIYDRETGRTFKIEDFPFQPVVGIYHFYSGYEWDAGLRVNDLIVDEKYHPQYNYSSNYADAFRAETIYKDGMYNFQFQVVFKKTGRYILLFTDMYEAHSASKYSDELNAEANAVDWEGKCSTPSICTIVQGNAHLDEFMDELVYLDDSVYRGGLTSLKGVDSPLFSVGADGIIVEYSGVFGFYVEE